MGRPSKRADLAGIAMLLGLYLEPVAIGPLIFHSTWRAVGIAYAAWLCLLLLSTLWPGGPWREKLGWAVGLGMFFTTPAVVTLLLLLDEIGGIQ